MGQFQSCLVSHRDTSKVFRHLEVVGGKGDDVEEQGRHIDSHQGAQQTPAEAEAHGDTAVRLGLVYSLLFYIILGKVYWSSVYNIARNWKA